MGWLFGNGKKQEPPSRRCNVRERPQSCPLRKSTRRFHRRNGAKCSLQGGRRVDPYGGGKLVTPLGLVLSAMESVGMFAKIAFEGYTLPGQGPRIPAPRYAHLNLMSGGRSFGQGLQAFVCKVLIKFLRIKIANPVQKLRVSGFWGAYSFDEIRVGIGAATVFWGAGAFPV